MDPALLEATSAAWSSVSALAVIALGLVAFAGGRARMPGSLAFTAFALTWAAHVLVGRWMAYVDVGSASLAHLVFAALLLPLPYLLTQFARAHAPGANGPFWRATTAATIVLPLLASAILLLDPALLYQGPLLVQGRPAPQWGPLYPVLFVAPFFLAFLVALLELDRIRRAATTVRVADRYALFAGGIATFIAFTAANNLAFYAADAALSRQLPASGTYTILFCLVASAVVFVGVHAARDARRAPSAKSRAPSVIVAVATLVPFAWGLFEGLLAYELLPRFSSVGLWRLAGVALLAYAIARARMPELSPRSRHAVALGAGVAASALLGGLTIGLFLLLRPGTPIILLAGFAIPLVTLSPSVRMARRVLRVRAEPDLTNGTLARRIETYRAALEASLARASLGDDDDFLAGLRQRLAIGDDVHDALLCIARESIPAPPDASYPGYERLRLLGEGAHGRAWLARQRFDDDLVVLKEPRDQDEASRADLARQARIAQALRHPNLVPIQRYVDTPRGAFLVLEHMPGGSLADRLERGPLDPAAAVRYAIETLRGLEALHAGGVVHGDVKPANVLLDEDGHARLSDYGLARGDQPDATRTLLSGQGTLSALAPEQLDGAAASKASDVYAAGALLYRLLTGEHYLSFARADPQRARQLIREGAPRLPHPHVPAALDPILRAALEKDPARRPASAGAMRGMLEAAASRLQHEGRGPDQHD